MSIMLTSDPRSRTISSSSVLYRTKNLGFFFYSEICQHTKNKTKQNNEVNFSLVSAFSLPSNSVPEFHGTQRHLVLSIQKFVSLIITLSSFFFLHRHLFCPIINKSFLF